MKVVWGCLLDLVRESFGATLKYIERLPRLIFVTLTSRDCRV